MSRRRKKSSERREHSARIASDSRIAYELVGLAIILATIFFVYRPSLYGAQIWDDDAHITRPELQSILGLYRIWFQIGATQQYYPLLHSAFWIEHKLWGDSVLGYHLVNVGLHMLSVSLLYFILKRLKIPGALLAAAIFAVHPVMVESVAWISEQKNTLSAVFYLGAMLVYLGFDQSRRRSQYVFALTLFALGLLTKTVTATLPAALLVIFWWQRGTLSWKRDVRPLIPFFVLSAAAGVLTAWFERNLVGAEGADFELSLVQRALLAGRVIWFYVGKLLWPANLIFFYPRWEIDPAAWWQWLFPAAALGVLVFLWMLRRKARGPLAGWLLFCGTLFPVLGFLNVFPFIYSFVADHFQYLASLGIIVLAAAGTAQVVGCLPKPARLTAGVACILLLAMLGMLASRQGRMYADNYVLYQTTIDRNPACWNVYNNIASQLASDGNVQAAITYYRRAIEIKPDSFMVHSNLGAMLAGLGQYPEAIEHMQYVLKLKPNYFSGHKNLARAFALSGRLAEAIDEYRKAIALRPNHPEALNSLGSNLMAVGQPSEAIEYFKHALQIQPDFAEACENLAKALASANRPNEAIESAQRAIDLARRSGQRARADRVEEWLKHYQIEVRR